MLDTRPDALVRSSGPVCIMTDEPVPYVAFTSPGRVQSCAASAACESPSTPQTGTGSAKSPPIVVWPKTESEGSTSASAERGTPKVSQSSSLHRPLAISRSCVRQALDGSVANACSWVSLKTSHESMVPSARVPRSAASPTAGTFLMSQASFAAEKYGESGMPERARTRSASSGRSVESLSQRSLARPHCHTIALASGSRVSRSQARQVSRWLEMPTARTSPAVTPAPLHTSRETARTLVMISSGSCSTHPRPSTSWACGRAAFPTTSPSAEKSTALVPWVDWSMASTSSRLVSMALTPPRGREARSRSRRCRRRRDRSGRRPPTRSP